jgi:hypothetical protein
MTRTTAWATIAATTQPRGQCGILADEGAGVCGVSAHRGANGHEGHVREQGKQITVSPQVTFNSTAQLDMSPALVLW